MKVVASTDEYTIYQRRDGRYAVKDAGKKPVNGDAKVVILLQHELITAPEPKAAEPEEVVAEAAEGEAEAAAEETAEASAEEAAEEEAAEEEAPAEEPGADANEDAEEDK